MLPEQALAVECGLEFASTCTLPAREVAAACEIYSGAIRHDRRFKARRCSSAGLRTAPHEGASLMVREGKERSSQRMLGRTCAQRLLGSPQWSTLPVLGSLGLGARGDGSRFMICECAFYFRFCVVILMLFFVGRSAVAATEGLFRKPRSSIGISATVPTVSVSCGSEVPLVSIPLSTASTQTSVPDPVDSSTATPQPETRPTAPALSDLEVTDGDEPPVAGITQAAVVPFDAGDSDLDFGVNLSESPLTVGCALFSVLL